MQHYKCLIFRSVSSEESAQYFVVSCDSIDLVLQQGPTKPSTDIANLRKSLEATSIPFCPMNKTIFTLFKALLYTTQSPLN